MENQELNIADILNESSKGTKLWSPAYGQCELHEVMLMFARPIEVEVSDGTRHSLLKDTRIYKDGVPMLFPSKEMRDWKKFVWKKGDVLKAGVDNLCIFYGWESDDYTEFHAKFATPHYSGETFETKEWTKETNKDNIKQYISKIEEFKGGKLNLETLEIEKQPEFKDGDILTCNGFIFIFKMSDANSVYAHATCDTYNKDNVEYGVDVPFVTKNFIAHFQYATEEEKQRLFNALAKEGKAWDSDKKQIVDLTNEEKKCEFQPFDKVLVHSYGNIWQIGLFVKMDESKECIKPYTVFDLLNCITDDFKYCIPYNEETKHLLGVTDDWK